MHVQSDNTVAAIKNDPANQVFAKSLELSQRIVFHSNNIIVLHSNITHA